MVCEVTFLAHQSQNISVKVGTFTTKFFLSGGQSMKVFCCLWNSACKQLEGDAAQGLAISSNVKELGGVDWGRSGVAAASARPEKGLISIIYRELYITE